MTNKIIKIMIPAFTKEDFTENKFMSKTKQDVKHLIERRLLCAEHRSQHNVHTLFFKFVSINFEYLYIQHKQYALSVLKKFN